MPEMGAGTMTERQVIIDQNQTPARVIAVVEVDEGETFHPPTDIPGRRSVEVPEDAPAAEGWTWTEESGLKAS